MLRLFAIFIVVSIFLVGFVVVIPFMPSQNLFAIVKGNCPNINFLWEHTVEHRRFVEHLPPCVVLEGVINNDPKISDEGDGDFKFDVTPDKGYGELMNTNNGKGMVIEIICWSQPQPSYIKQHGDYCKNVDARSHFPSLKYNDHVRITGKWVQDIGYPKPDHVQWNEIHPVEKIEILPKK